MSYAFAQLPLLKILLHAAKHPTCTINGMLLGSAQGSGAEAAVHVTDVVPLFHASCNLAAPTEMALAQVGCWAVAQAHAGMRMPQQRRGVGGGRSRAGVHARGSAGGRRRPMRRPMRRWPRPARR